MGEVAGKEAFLDGGDIGLDGEIITDWDLHLDHQLLELLTDIVSSLEMPMIEIIFITPVNIHILTFVLMEGIHDGDVVTFGVDKFCMGVCCLLKFLFGTEEDVRATHARYDCEDLLYAFVFGGAEEGFGELGLEGKFGHFLAFRSEISFIIQGTQIVQQFQSSHQSLRCRRIHKIKMHQIINP